MIATIRLEPDELVPGRLEARAPWFATGLSDGDRDRLARMEAQSLVG